MVAHQEKETETTMLNTKKTLMAALAALTLAVAPLALSSDAFAGGGKGGGKGGGMGGGGKGGFAHGHGHGHGHGFGRAVFLASPVITSCLVWQQTPWGFQKVNTCFY
jgi:hypothetical protein